MIEGYGQTFGSALYERWDEGGREIANAIQPIPREDEEDLAVEDGVGNGVETGTVENGANGNGNVEGVDMQE